MVVRAETPPVGQSRDSPSGNSSGEDTMSMASPLYSLMTRSMRLSSMISSPLYCEVLCSEQAMPAHLRLNQKKISFPLYSPLVRSPTPILQPAPSPLYPPVARPLTPVQL